MLSTLIKTLTFTTEGETASYRFDSVSCSSAIPAGTSNVMGVAGCVFIVAGTGVGVASAWTTGAMLRPRLRVLETAPGKAAQPLKLTTRMSDNTRILFFIFPSTLVVSHAPFARQANIDDSSRRPSNVDYSVKPGKVL